MRAGLAERGLNPADKGVDMKTRIASAVAFVMALSVVGVYAQNTARDVDRLLGELGVQASDDLLRDLGDPTLLPATGDHQAVFFWNVSSATPQGALALVVPPAVRVGRTLLDLRDQGVQFTDSFAVRRILNATEMWDRFTESPAYRSSWKSATLLVDRNSLRPGEVVTFTDGGLRERISVSEISGPALDSMEPWPKPGELYCCQRYNIYPTAHGYRCEDAGTGCEICKSCGGGRDPGFPREMVPIN
jgi:hypothetical protein